MGGHRFIHTERGEPVMMDREERIRRKAYELWEAAGCPHGDDQGHWHAAVAAIDAEDAAAAPRRAAKPKAEVAPAPAPTVAAPAAPVAKPAAELAAPVAAKPVAAKPVAKAEDKPVAKSVAKSGAKPAAKAEKTPEAPAVVAAAKKPRGKSSSRTPLH
jgi:hypothetical protein